MIDEKHTHSANDETAILRLKAHEATALIELLDGHRAKLWATSIQDDPEARTIFLNASQIEVHQSVLALLGRDKFTEFESYWNSPAECREIRVD